MKHVTIGRQHGKGKIAYVRCVQDAIDDPIEIKDQCFLLIALTEGTASFKIGDEIIEAIAPCFICFNELEDPIVLSKNQCKCFSIYFHPMFLNVNMTFALIRSGFYGDIAHIHDLFLLKPFLDGHHVVPISMSNLEKIQTACKEMRRELQEQRDWYWSCRGRSYFMEVIISLERMYGLMGHGKANKMPDRVASIRDPKLREAVLYMEGHYMEQLTLGEIASAGEMNRTTITRLLKKETGMTTMEYLMDYRIKMAKKQLAFTDVPIKDIVVRCGFKTVQHFSRVFKEHTGETPADFRKDAVQKRKDELTLG